MAIKSAEELLAVGPDDAACQIGALQAFLQSGEPLRASRLALCARPNWQGNARLSHLSLLALLRVGDKVAATEAAQAVVATSPDDPRMVSAAADALIQGGRASEAKEALEAALTPDSRNARAWFELARARHLLSKDGIDALTAVRTALEIEPGSVRSRELAARILLALGMHSQALAELETVPEAKRNEKFLVTLIDVCAAGGDVRRVSALAWDLASRRPANFVLNRHLSAVLGRLGQVEVARAINDNNLRHRNAELPDLFANGLTRLMKLPVSSTELAPRARLDWLWRQLVRAGRPPSDRLGWEKEVARVARLDRFFLDWIECRPQSLAETSQIMMGTEIARAEVAGALTEGNGVLIAAAHIGLLFGSVAAIALSGLPMAFVASAPNLGNQSHDGHLISASTQNDSAVARSIYRAVQAGKVVAVAIEGGAESSGKVKRRLFDREIEVSSFVPGLAWRTGTPSFFPFMAWNGGKAEISVHRLPDAKGFSTLESYRDAWLEAYLLQLETALITYPASARASGGFWRGITL